MQSTTLSSEKPTLVLYFISVVKITEVQIRGSFLYFASQRDRRAQLVAVDKILKINICHPRLWTNNENKLPDLNKHSESSHLQTEQSC